MRDESTVGTVYFLLKCALYGVAGVVWYRNLLFRALPGLSYGQSWIVLWGLVAWSVITGTFFCYRCRKTEWTADVSVLLPFGLYTVVAYARLAWKLAAAALGVAAVLSAVTVAATMTGKVGEGNRKAVLRRRAYRCFCRCQSYLAVSLTVVMVLLGVRGIFRKPLAEPASVSPEAGRQGPEQTISGNMETLLSLQEERWAELSVRERLDVLQTVANIEAYYLGIPHELKVGASPKEESLLGDYLHADHTIYINLDHLERDPAQQVLKTCCHEAYHSYQYCLVEAYQQIGAEYRELLFYHEVQTYEQEFLDYKDGEDGFLDYYHQQCESDAREYAGNAVADYYDRIEKYVKETGV